MSSIKVATAKDAYTKPHDYKEVEIEATVYDDTFAIHPKVNETDPFPIMITHIKTGYALKGAKYKTVAEKIVKLALDSDINWDFSNPDVCLSEEYREKAEQLGEKLRSAGLI